ncbi:MAG: SH3 domain-containing protein [Actinomycetota bacterium]
MRRPVDNVVTWKARTVPGDRVIPKHLKLAILSRGRITVPTRTVQPILDEAGRRGVSWPSLLRTPLDQIYADVHLVVELFQIQRAGMTTDQIDETIAAYLVGRKAQTYPQCAFLEWTRQVIHSIGDRRAMEAMLELDLTKLFTRPRVQVGRGGGPPRHVLVAYVCVPFGVTRFLAADPTLTAPLLPSPQLALPTPLDRLPTMPPLEARTDARDELNLRTAPSTTATSLGVLAGHEAAVRILDKHLGVDGSGDPLLWYQIETTEPLSVTVKPVSDGPSPRTLLPAGTRMWTARGAIKIAAAPWELFRRDLRSWEATLPFLTPIGERITPLRQQSHARDLIFDEVIGTRPGSVYVEDHTDVTGRWTMFLNYEAVIAPDGRWVDLQHLLVGLDVLARDERPVTVSRLGVSFDVGTNWSAATWAGDLGSAVADSQTEGTGAWASYAKPRTRADRMNFFLRTNSPDFDLLGDLDPWGILPILDERQDVQSLDDLLALYYEDLVQPVFDIEARPSNACLFTARPVVRRRATSISRFLQHHGFAFPDGAGDDPTTGVLPPFQDQVSVLRSQGAARGTRRRIHQFAEVWRAYRGPVTYALGRTDAALLRVDEDQANEYFLDWLAIEAMSHCVDTEQVPVGLR